MKHGKIAQERANNTTGHHATISFGRVLIAEIPI